MDKDSAEAAAIFVIVIAALGVLNMGVAMGANVTNSTTSNTFNSISSSSSTVNTSTISTSSTVNTTSTTSIVDTMTSSTVNTTSTINIFNTTTTLNGTTSNIPSLIPRSPGIPILNGTGNTVRGPSTALINARGGFARTSLAVRSRGANLNISTGSVLYGVRVRFKNSTVTRFNVSVANGTQVPAMAPAPSALVYQYIQINDTVYNTTNSVDPYISNVTYNFQVQSGWLAQQGIAPQNITLLKYINSSQSWISLQTSVVGFNSSDFFYSAVSNSFSTYAITYPGPANAAVTGQNSITLLLSSQPSFNYFWAFAVNALSGARAGVGFNWTSTSNAFLTVNAPNNANAIVSTGWSTKPSATYNNPAATANTGNMVIVGVAANVVEANSKVFVGNGLKVSSNSLTFTVATANSLVIVMSGISNGLNATTNWLTVNSALANVVYGNSLTNVWAGIRIFNSLPAGTYKESTNAINTNAIIATSIFVFPTYTVTFNDIPGTGSIATNGVSQKTANAVAGLLGTGTINAIAPNANFIFSSWTVKNAVNTIVASSTSSNTYLTVEGNSVVTANYNGLTTFLETGLPGGTTWNVVYNGILSYNSLSPNNANVVFNTIWLGSASYTVNSQVVGGSTYIPSPASGTVVVGNGISVAFSLASCFVSVSNTLVNFGSITTGSNVPTQNAVTVTDNSGSVAANILIEGGIGNVINPANDIWKGTSAGNTIGISNTVWSASLNTAYGSATRVSNTPVDTQIQIPSPGGGSASNNIYLGMGIPRGTPADTYTTNVVIEITC